MIAENLFCSLMAKAEKRVKPNTHIIHVLSASLNPPDMCCLLPVSVIDTNRRAVWKIVLLKYTPFIVVFSVFGCPYPSLPSNAHIVSTASGPDVIRIQCNGSSDWWTLQCIGVTWSGTTGNCTDSK
jgi:hypothetical protein